MRDVHAGAPYFVMPMIESNEEKVIVHVSKVSTESVREGRMSDCPVYDGSCKRSSLYQVSSCGHDDGATIVNCGLQSPESPMTETNVQGYFLPCNEHRLENRLTDNDIVCVGLSVRGNGHIDDSVCQREALCKNTFFGCIHAMA